ncbi:MAG TPA: lipoyl(octanoyl) transferase LipB [Terriglobales bacterium]|nr:lipoyl(octanoyl) transferase LipB [Terriglobales bacterium]
MISVLHLRVIDYGTALLLQQSLVDLRKHRGIPDVLLLLEHPPVITFGRNSSRANLLASDDMLRKKSVELFESDRGGDITFHGPGQLVGYPIFDLRGFSPRIGAVEFVRHIEEALIRTCGDLGIPAERICGLTGVWTQGAAQAVDCDGVPKPSQLKAAAPESSTHKKIAAIGVHISRGITSHGFALNVTTDLDYFKLIVPCGISDRPVTSIAQELTGKRAIPSMEQVANAISLNFGRVFARQMLWVESLEALLPAQERAITSENADQKNDGTNPVGVPLIVPEDIRGVRREQRPSTEDEVFLA